MQTQLTMTFACGNWCIPFIHSVMTTGRQMDAVQLVSSHNLYLAVQILPVWHEMPKLLIFICIVLVLPL